DEAFGADVLRRVDRRRGCGAPGLGWPAARPRGTRKARDVARARARGGMMATSAITIPLLAELAGRAALVLALAWLGARLAFRRSASTRYAVWAAGFIAAFALPIATGILPAWRLAVLPPQDAPLAVVAHSTESPLQ